MLGAQARAAEYNAARNASARQASREAEEQKLPPKTAPLTLGSFTRTAALNRNKGAKKYTPLILEQTEEAGEDEETEEDSAETATSPTHANQDTNLDNPTSEDRIRVRLPIVPGGPRVMRPVADPFTNQSSVDFSNAIMEVNAARFGAQHNAGAYPYPGYAWYGLGLPMPEMTPEGMRTYGNMMVPTDITPTKQEQKLYTISHGYNDVPSDIVNLANPINHQALKLSSMPLTHPGLDQHSIALAQGWDYGQYQPIFGNQVVPRPALIHAQSDVTPLTRSTENPAYPRILTRHQSANEEMLQHKTPARENTHQSTNDTPLSKPREIEEPYDRTNKMQLFMATQQAFAKTGKTVLNSSETRKVQRANTAEEPNARAAAQHVTPARPEVEPITKNDSAESTAPRDRPRMVKGFPQADYVPNTPEDPSVAEDQSGEPELISVDDTRLRAVFDVGSDDWLNLEPPNASYRNKMAAAINYVGSKLCEDFRRPLTTQRDIGAFKDFDRHLHEDAPDRRATKIEVEKIATSLVVSRQQTNGKESDTDQSTEAGLLRAAGGIMVTLTEYIRDRQTDEGEEQQEDEERDQDFFNRVKQVPEFAIEQPGLGTNLVPPSLFEDARGGFSNAPIRIARDPRFRPHARDHGQVRSEDEWLYRHEMYGKRRV